MVSVPGRAISPVFAGKEKLTVPSPLPELPDVIVSHAALLLAAQEQPAVAVTPTDPSEAPAPNEAELEVKE
jgi:hypothetical protein